jgi:hypothetical protein
MVATWDRFERLFCASDAFRLVGLMSEDILGERESWREGGRGAISFIESIESDVRCVSGG